MNEDHRENRSTPPETAAGPLAATQTGPQFDIPWAGTDSVSGLAGANLFVLQVIIQSFYDTENADVEDWLMALNHYIRMMHWLEEEEDSIADRTRVACT